MNQEKLISIASQFAIEGDIAEINALGEGFINDTFVVTTAGDAPNYILQRKNHVVFPDVPGMMDNILAVTEHIKKKVADPMRETLTVIPACDGKLYVKDAERDTGCRCGRGGRSKKCLCGRLSRGRQNGNVREKRADHNGRGNVYMLLRGVCAGGRSAVRASDYGR